MTTAEEVRRWCAAGECLTVEFKRGASSSLSDSDIVTAVVCQTNGPGGTVLLGVEDDGRITGLDPRHGTVTDPHRLRSLILNNTEPPVATDVEVFDVDGLPVAVIQVGVAPSPVGTKAGLFVRRSTRTDGRPQCIPYSAHEIVSDGRAARQTDFALVPARGLRPTDLDAGELSRFRRLCGSDRGDRSLRDLEDLDLLRALRLTDPAAAETDRLTIGAVLLFGTQEALAEHVPTAECLFQEVTSGAVTTNETLRAPLFRLAERLFDLVDARNTEQELMVGLQRVGVPRVPRATIREAVANALTHRDYTELGPVVVQLTEDAFRVSNPGGFPPGITLRNILDDSRPRSPALADAFKRAGFVDRAGRGVREMYQALLRSGRGGPDYSASNDKTVVLTVPTSDADLSMIRFVVDYENDVQRSLGLNSLRILRELHTMGSSTPVELATALAVPEPTVRSDLSALTAAGIVETRGTGRHRRHHLAAAFYRAAERSEYVRFLDTDPIQQGQMVLAYVDQFGTITRAKAAQLCRLTPPQARVVLRRLVDRGELEIRGERRTARYVRPGGRSV